MQREAELLKKIQMLRERLFSYYYYVYVICLYIFSNFIFKLSFSSEPLSTQLPSTIPRLIPPQPNPATAAPVSTPAMTMYRMPKQPVMQLRPKTIVTAQIAAEQSKPISHLQHKILKSPAKPKTAVNLGNAKAPALLIKPHPPPERSSSLSDFPSDFESFSDLSDDEAVKPVNMQIEKPEPDKTDTSQSEDEEQELGKLPKDPGSESKSESETYEKQIADTHRQTNLGKEKTDQPLREQLGLSESESSDLSSEEELNLRVQTVPLKPPAVQLQGTKRKETNGQKQPKARQTKSQKRAQSSKSPSKDHAPQQRQRSYPYAHEELESYIKNQIAQREKKKKEDAKTEKKLKREKTEKLVALHQNTRKRLAEHLRNKNNPLPTNINSNSTNADKAIPHSLPTAPLHERFIVDAPREERRADRYVAST